jgi:hypothetical protein
MGGRRAHFGAPLAPSSTGSLWRAANTATACTTQQEHAQSQGSKTEHTIDFVKRTGDILLLKLTDSDIAIHYEITMTIHWEQVFTGPEETLWSLKLLLCAG